MEEQGKEMESYNILPVLSPYKMNQNDCRKVIDL